ncbi:MAG: peptidoglycan-binding domain-containing protein, partial [Pseudomonadota bacterium]
MRPIIRSLLAATLMAAPTSLAAADLALIFANTTYKSYSDPADVRAVPSLEGDFQRAGFQTLVIRDTGTNASPAQAEVLWSQMDEADRLVVVFAGHILGTRGQTWLLHSDGGDTSALTIGRDAVPVQPFFDLLAARPGEAVVILADSARAIPTGSGVNDKPTLRGVPQGVVAVQGEAGPVVEFVRNELLRPGRSFRAAARRAPDGVRVTGFLSRSIGLVPRGSDSGQVSEEDRLWSRAQRRDEAAAYQAYLDRFPRGEFAAEARLRLAALTPSPEDRARATEEALELDIDRRRAVQRQLTLLGFNTRGVDGIFGPNTRTAIANFQRSLGDPTTGYLTGNQVARLQAAAQARAAQLQREAEERRRLAEARDRAWWTETGQGETEEGLRAYLNRFPDGLFADEAQSRLAALERQRRREAEEAERLAWDKAVMTGTIASYRDYLGTYPTGIFAAE